MDDLLAGRMQMAFSLGFHIVFAVIGMVMPFLMAMAHWRYLRTEDQVYRELAKAWAKGVAIFFAVGAVSGTLLSFELGTLWPGFMEHAGPIIGMPFSLEGTAFFVEAIALGLFLYGWDRINKWIHFGSGVVVGLSGLASGILVVSANAWMNSPRGFDYDPVTGIFSNIEPWQAMFNDAWASQALHMSLAAVVATGFGVAGLHAFQLLRRPESAFHRQGLNLAMILASIGALLQPLSGHQSAQDIADRQPAKLAAMEAHFETTDHADLLIGGIPDEETGTVSYGIHIPGGLSFLAFNDTEAVVMGLNDFPKDERPPVLITHFAFQLMVGIGTLLALIGLLFWLFRWKWPDRLHKRWWLRILALSAPLGFFALEAGWVVTEVGRQPWIIHKVMRTAEALTPMPGLVYTFVITTLVFVFLGLLVFWLMTRQIRVVNEKESMQNSPVVSKPLSP